MMELFRSALAALIASLFCLYLLRPLAVTIGLVDRPDERKQHINHVPLIGGLVIFFGFCFSLLTLHISLMQYRGLLAGAILLVLMGVLDDFHNISSRLRLVGHLIASLFLVIWSGALLAHLGNFLFIGDFNPGLWALPLTIVIIMANINAMNMVDGQDGLAGGIALGQCTLLAWLAYQVKNFYDLRLLIILGVLLLVFLSFNMRGPWRKTAAIFLGDAGSTLLAFLLVWFAIRLSQIDVLHFKPIVILWVMSFPLFDLLNVVIYRASRGKSVFRAGRDHIHHVLHVAGIDASLSTLLLVFFSVSLGLIGIMLNYLRMAEGWQFLLWLFILTSYLLGVHISRNKYEQK